MIKKIILLVLPVILFSGCATLSTSKMIETTKSQGVEHIFNHPYKDVFYACEDRLMEVVFGQWGHWNVGRSSIKDGIIEAKHSGRRMIIIVKRLEENKTLVKMQKFGLLFGGYQKFFKDVERLARRCDYN